MIKAVFFDWFNTLAYCEPPREQLWGEVCRELGYDINRKTILRGIFAADYLLASPLKSDDKEGQQEKFLNYPRMIFQEAGINADNTLIMRAMEIMYKLYKGFSYCLFDDVAPVLQDISKRGIAVGVISNADNEMMKVYDEIGLTPLLDIIVTSEDAGVSKPESGIFNLALEKAGVTAAEAVHVGDQYEMDTVGALGAGMKAVLIDRYDIYGDNGFEPRIVGLNEMIPLLQS